MDGNLKTRTLLLLLLLFVSTTATAQDRFKPSYPSVGTAVTAYLAGKSVDGFVVHKFGKNSSTAAGEAIAEPGGAYPYLNFSGSFNIRVASGGNAADTSAGTGARTIKVQGLDASGLIAEETITLAGTSATTDGTQNWSRVLRAFVATAGTGRVNAGNIVVEKTDGTDLATIVAGEGQSELGYLMVPPGFQCALTHVLIDTTISSGSGTVRVSAYQRSNGLTVNAPFGAKRLFYQVQSVTKDTPALEFNFEEPILFDGETDVWFEATPSTGTPAVTVDFTMVCWAVT